MDVDPMGVPTGMSTDSGGQPASAPGFNGNKTIGRLRTQGEPVHEPPAAESDKPQEKSGFQEFIDHEKHNVTEAAKHPWEAAKGAIKGTLNTVPALGDMVLKGGAYIYSTNAEQVSSALKYYGADGLSQSVGESARSISQAGQAVDLPKFQMSNAAQAGGDTIATVASLALGGAGLAKGAIKGAASAGRAVAGAEASGAKLLAGAEQSVAKAEAHLAQESAAAASPGGGTVVARKSLRDQYLGRTPGKNSKTGKEVQERMRQEGTLRDTPDGVQFKSQQDGRWYSIADADMAHKQDAVSWWNETGRNFGAKSSETRSWMLDSNNYSLEHYSFNRSAGAKLKEGYLPPLK